MADIEKLKRLTNAVSSAAHVSTVQGDAVSVRDLEAVADATKRALYAIIEYLEKR